MTRRRARKTVPYVPSCLLPVSWHCTVQGVTRRTAAHRQVSEAASVPR